MSQAGSVNQLIPPPGTMLFLEGDLGGPVAPDGGGVIFVVGGTNISTIGTPGSNTITINAGETPYDVTTTNAVPTLIATITIANGTATNIACSFIAIQDTFATTIGGTAFTVARNAGAGAILAGGAGGHQNVIDDSAGFPEITFVTSVNDVEIFVTGVAATTYDWRMSVSTFTV